MNMLACNSIILAAGRSDRYGEPKFSLRFDATRSFLEKIVAEYVALACAKIVVVINAESLPYFQSIEWLLPNTVKIVVNQTPEAGRFSSLKTGLSVLMKAQPTFIQNIDNPFVNLVLLQALSKSLHQHDGVCPIFQTRGGHPILLSRNLVHCLQSADSGLDFKQFLRGFNIHKLEVADASILANINTRDDYAHWFGTISTISSATGENPN